MPSPETDKVKNEVIEHKQDWPGYIQYNVEKASLDIYNNHIKPDFISFLHENYGTSKDVVKKVDRMHKSHWPIFGGRFFGMHWLVFANTIGLIIVFIILYMKNIIKF